MQSTLYLTLEEVLALHDVCIHEFGGLKGVRNFNLLESATMQPRQTFGEQDLYPSIWDKAATLSYSISENQPFLDGNKRTAALCMLVFLEINGCEIIVPRGQIYEIMFKVATKIMNRTSLSKWLRNNSKKIKWISA